MYIIRYEGPEDNLRGVIVCKDDENGYRFLYKDEDVEDVDVHSVMVKYDTFKSYKDADKQLDLKNNPLVRDWDHIIPNTRIRSSIRARVGFLLKFYMFGVVYQDVNFEFPTDHPEDFSSSYKNCLIP